MLLTQVFQWDAKQLEIETVRDNAFFYSIFSFFLFFASFIYDQAVVVIHRVSLFHRIDREINKKCVYGKNEQWKDKKEEEINRYSVFAIKQRGISANRQSVGADGKQNDKNVFVFCSYAYCLQQN